MVTIIFLSVSGLIIFSVILNVAVPLFSGPKDVPLKLLGMVVSSFLLGALLGSAVDVIYYSGLDDAFEDAITMFALIEVVPWLLYWDGLTCWLKNQHTLILFVISFFLCYLTKKKE